MLAWLRSCWLTTCPKHLCDDRWPLSLWRETGGRSYCCVPVALNRDKWGWCNGLPFGVYKLCQFYGNEKGGLFDKSAGGMGNVNVLTRSWSWGWPPEFDYGEIGCPVLPSPYHKVNHVWLITIVWGTEARRTTEKSDVRARDKEMEPVGMKPAAVSRPCPSSEHRCSKCDFFLNLCFTPGSRFHGSVVFDKAIFYITLV